jgi:hypothetical protein
MRCGRQARGARVIPILVRAAALNAVGNITLLGERRLRARAVHEQPVSICRTDALLRFALHPATRLRRFTWSPIPEEHLDAAEQLQYSRSTKTGRSPTVLT